MGWINAAQAQEILCVEDQAASDYFLAWEPPAVPCGPFVSYEVWASNDPLNAFSLIATITDELITDYTHVNGINVGSPIYYYIIYNYNCPGQAPIISETATSNFGSYQPEITSIQVNPNSIQICWEESDFIQTDAYIISYLLPNGLAFPLDTIVGITNTCYTDLVSNINDPDLVYTLTYLDGCGNFSQYNDIGYQFIQLSAEQEGCNQLIEYEWDNYTNPYNLDFSYTVYVKVNNNPYDSLSNQAELQNVFNFFNFVDGDSISVYVEIVDENGVVRSNSPVLSLQAEVVQPPREFYIYYLSVVDDNQIDISYFIDSIAELRNMDIDTSKYGVDFDMTGRYDRSEFSNLGNIYLPDTVSPKYHESRYYQIGANDSCNTDYVSTIGRTIYVEAFLNDFFKNEIAWNAFELENAVVFNYKIYRDYGDGMQFVQDVLPIGPFEYIDDLSPFYEESGTFCYRIEAEYTFTYPDGSTENFVSQSNIGCVEQRPAVYIPNAIVPSGINNEFKPMIVFGNPIEYTMQIFTRWGEQIFQSNDYNTGWFGTNNGNLVPTGGYPYVIKFKASDGQTIEKKGIVTVIR